MRRYSFGLVTLKKFNRATATNTKLYQNGKSVKFDPDREKRIDVIDNNTASIRSRGIYGIKCFLCALYPLNLTVNENYERNSISQIVPLNLTVKKTFLEELGF